MDLEYQKALIEANNRWKELHSGFKELGFTCVRNDSLRNQTLDDKFLSVYSKRVNEIPNKLYLIADVPGTEPSNSNPYDCKVTPFISNVNEHPILIGVIEEIGFVMEQFNSKSYKNSLLINRGEIEGEYLGVPESFRSVGTSSFDYIIRKPADIILAIQKLEQALVKIPDLEKTLEPFYCE